jgi:hypothetical protein
VPGWFSRFSGAPPGRARLIGHSPEHNQAHRLYGDYWHADQPRSSRVGACETRGRESNPRPRTHREEPLQACPAIGFRPPAGSQAAYRRASHPLESRSGRLALPRRQARCWRRIPSHGPKTERRRYLTRLGGECEIVLRTCFVCRWIYEANRRPRLAALPENRPRRNSKRAFSISLS